jgi:hypothetical protein
MLQIVLVVIVLTFPSVVSLVAVVAGGWWHSCHGSVVINAARLAASLDIYALTRPLAEASASASGWE